jgi:hypothetical protein
MEPPMKQLLFVIAAVSLLTGCFDVLESPPPQCDAQRRCSPADQPVCGDDGAWHPCELQMDCLGVEPAPDVVCEDRCPDLDCATDCGDAGHKAGADGCLTCECVSQCEPVDEDCETEIGEDGCPRCVEQQCGGVLCDLFCENGFAVDENGCEICACNEVQCPDPIGCPAECDPVYDDGGCLIDCDCTNACEPFDERGCLDSPNCHVETDPDGCQTCVCEEGECQRTFCNNYCEHGYEIVDGCPTCQCHEPCLELPECDLACPTGNTVDPLTGCVNSCECRTEMCSGVACALDCLNGFRRDGSGCEVCECRGAPCSTDQDCGLDEHCVASDAGFVGECVALEHCDANLQCPDGGQCGFYYRDDCCPPLTTCGDGLPACPAVCLLSPVPPQP